MSHGLRFLLSVVLVATPAARAAENKTVNLAGWVSDASCGAQHTKPGGADCIRKCLRGGASVGHPEWTPQKMVFVPDGEKKIWIVENPEALAGREGEHVKILASVHAAQLSLFVQRVSPFPAEKKTGG